MEQHKYNIFKAIIANRDVCRNRYYYCGGRYEKNNLYLIGSEFFSQVAEEIIEDHLQRVGVSCNPDLKYSDFVKICDHIDIEWEPLFGRREHNGLCLEKAHNFSDEEKEKFRFQLQIARDESFIKRKFCDPISSLEI